MNKLLSILSTALAGVTLCGALVYYNFIDKSEVNENARCVGEESFDFTIETFGKDAQGNFTADGETFTLSESRGKVVVLNFWATWCAPCKAEIPHFNEVYEEYSDEIEMVIINTETNISRETMTSQYLNNGVGENAYIGWTDYSCKFAGYDTQNNVLDLFLVVAPNGEKKVSQTLPLTVIVDKDGVIRYAAEGPMSGEQLIEQISHWL